MTAHWQHPETQEWHEFEHPPTFLQQSTSQVCAMFEGNKPPVVIKIDGGFICTSNIMAEVRERNPGSRVAAFSNIKLSQQPFYKTLGF